MRVECWDVLELDISSDKEYENPFRDVVVTGTFKGAGKSKPVRLEGFYDGDGAWRVRFVPHRPGRWVYAVELDRAQRERRRHRHQPRPLTVHGSFDCESAPGRRGFVRISKRNPYRFEYDDGAPFYPIGQQIGSGVSANPPFDAPDDAKWHTTDRETFLKAFDGATNLVRS